MSSSGSNLLLGNEWEDQSTLCDKDTPTGNEPAFKILKFYCVARQRAEIKARGEESSCTESQQTYCDVLLP